MHLTSGLVAMAPKHEPFEDDENHDSRKESREDLGSRNVGERVRNQSEERRPQKRADGVTDQVGKEPLPDSRRKKQKRSRKADGTCAREQTEAENPQYRITLTPRIHRAAEGEGRQAAFLYDTLAATCTSVSVVRLMRNMHVLTETCWRSPVNASGF